MTEHIVGDSSNFQASGATNKNGSSNLCGRKVLRWHRILGRDMKEMMKKIRGNKITEGFEGSNTMCVLD